MTAVMLMRLGGYDGDAPSATPLTSVPLAT